MKEIRSLFNERKRRTVKDAIDKGDPEVFRKRENAIGTEEPYGDGNLIASGSVVVRYSRARKGASVHFNLKVSESVEIEGITFTYLGCKTEDGSESDHLSIQLEFGRRIRARIPFFDDSIIAIPDLDKRVVISPASKGSGPDSVTGTISVEKNDSGLF